MKKMRKHYHLLPSMKATSSRLRKAIIKFGKGSGARYSRIGTQCPKCQLKNSRCGCKRLREDKTEIWLMVDRGITVGKKRKLFVHRGGFQVPLLTASLLSLASLIRQLICCGRCCSYRHSTLTDYDTPTTSTPPIRRNATRGDRFAVCLKKQRGKSRITVTFE
jgi:hypothetical protein